MNKKSITIRWMDGMVETLEGREVRFSPHFIWVSFSDMDNRWVPTCNVRTFKLHPDSKMKDQLDK